MNELSTQNQDLALAISQVENPYDTPEDSSETTGSAFLPRLQLCSAKSEAVIDGLINMNNYGLVISKERVIDLGKDIDVYLICHRSRAIDTSQGNFRTSFDVKSDLFQEIKKKSFVPDSRCQFGREYLVWVPKVQQFATFFFGSLSARNEIPKVQQLVPGPASFTSRLVVGKGHKWQVPVVMQCSTPFEYPSVEATLAVQQEFLHPQDKTGPALEKVEDAPTRER
jgi:hypothetical protein